MVYRRDVSGDDTTDKTRTPGTVTGLPADRYINVTVSPARNWPWRV